MQNASPVDAKPNVSRLDVKVRGPSRKCLLHASLLFPLYAIAGGFYDEGDDALVATVGAVFDFDAVELDLLPEIVHDPGLVFFVRVKDGIAAARRAARAVVAAHRHPPFDLRAQPVMDPQ